MEVFITIDTECAEERVVGGLVRPPLGYDLMMRGRFDGYPDGLGVDLIVRELKRYGFQATFFVESLCAEYFGIAGLSAVCRDLIGHGQDIQLHLHPNFRQPQWRRSGMEPLSDDLRDYSLQSQEELLRRGLGLLEEAGVPRTSLVAFRAGNYGANNLTWHALQHCGLCLDSSLNLSYLGKDCGIVPTTPGVDLYEAIPGVWELPISCFTEGAGYRHLEITAVLFAEIRAGLERLRNVGAKTATIVTHPAEFFVIDDHIRARGRPNRINIARFRRLLAFLDKSRDRFEVRTVGSLAAELSAGVTVPVIPPAAVPAGSQLLRAARLPMQALKRLATHAWTVGVA